MITKEFKYNPNASYNPGIKYSKKDHQFKTNLVNQTIFVNQKENFKTAFPDLFQNYQNPSLHTNEPWNTWIHSSFDWWQCQLNFAVWCASTGCGVSYNDHKQNTSNLTKSVYMFHLYYCIARILKELKSPLPTDSSFCYYKNPYDKAAYQKLCDEFNISPNTDWRQKLESSSQGLGNFTQYYKPSGEYRYHHSRDGPFFNIRDTIYHTKDISMAWTTFILDKSEGFTKAGIERINESIKMYVWALLGAQSQTKTEILKVGTGFDAQKQFLANVQDVIDSPIDLPTQISNYQNVLKYARSKVDYAYGLGLYMSPSDMVLQIGTIVGYNNKIVIATENQTLGLNDDLNNKNFDFTGLDPVDFKPNKPKSKKSEPKKSEPKKSEPIQIEPIQKNEYDEHEDNKKAIIFGSIVLGITALIIYKIY
ncbi:unnamed protein product [Mytilus edulis]|uniref:Uncharacterized protein n=1 Tax=Mytilus edulis TaxID=6550 RepID=A0A8S3T3C7_MYTED|nr:unnamed protein product [Mytilus edulis]